MKRRIWLIVPVMASLLLSGCIEFLRQTMSYRNDSATDTLYIFQEYQGIFGGDKPGGLSEDEVNQWKSVMAGGRTFFFNNWITEFNRQSLIELQDRPQGELDADPAYEAAIRALAALALANVTVENVGLYYNKDKQLCGTQRVTVKKVSEVLAALNKVLLYAAREQAGKEDTSLESKTLLLKFFQSKQNVLRLEGNRLEVRWPITKEDFTNSEQDPEVVALRASGGELKYEGDQVVVVIGSKEAPSVSLTLPFSTKAYSTNLLAEVKQEQIMPSFDATRAARQFLSPAK